MNNDNLELSAFQKHNQNKRSGRFKPNLLLIKIVGVFNSIRLKIISLFDSLRGAWDWTRVKWPLYVIVFVGIVWMFWGSMKDHLPPTKGISDIPPVTVTSDTVTTNPPAEPLRGEPLREALPRVAPVLVVTEPVPSKPVLPTPAKPHNPQLNEHGLATVLPEKRVPKTITEPPTRRKASIDDGSLMRKLHRLREKVNQLRDHLNNERQRTAKLKSLLSQSDKQVKSLTDRVLVQTKLITNFKRIVGLAKEKIRWLERKSSLPTVKKTRPTSRYKLVGGRDMRGQGPPDYEIQLYIERHEHKVEINKYRKLLGLPLKK